ncbi:hypothetical protein MC885_003563, partial [Smutsia gigantea]
PLGTASHSAPRPPSPLSQPPTPFPGLTRHDVTGCAEAAGPNRRNPAWVFLVATPLGGLWASDCFRFAGSPRVSGARVTLTGIRGLVQQHGVRKVFQMRSCPGALHTLFPWVCRQVKSIRRRDRKASILFIEGHMDPKGRGIAVSLRRLKHFDCKEKQVLLNEAKEDFDQAIGWCVSLITDYRVRLGCGSFSGSFLEYYAADISYPVRKSIQQDVLGTRFPQLSKGDPQEPMVGRLQGRRQPRRKVLPDRSRAARDRANQKLVEYIVKARGAERHLQAILKNRKPSRWLKMFLNSGQYVTCVETYLEDEEQLDLVVKYLQRVYQEAGSRALAGVNGDRIRFILDVLLPEAIICAISAVDAVDYKTAEEKYIRGPSLGYREKEIFDNQLLEERGQRC